MDIYITNYSAPQRELPVELLIESAYSISALHTEPLREFFHDDYNLLHYSQLGLDYLAELKFRKVPFDPVLEVIELRLTNNTRSIPELTSPVINSMPPLSWRTDKTTEHKKFYLIACRQRILYDYHMGRKFTWETTPPEWFTKQDPKLKLGLGEITVNG